MSNGCTHISTIQTVRHPKQHVCEECVKIGAQWVHLRTCQSCGVTLCTVLPIAWPALVRADGEVLLALQTSARSADPSRDLAQALAVALETDSG